MCASHNSQLLTYSVRLPDEAQEDALRLLDASRAVANQTISILWPHLWPQLDEFGLKSKGPAWKQLGKYTGSPDPHGDRQWRCESETAGRILRAQAQRKKIFDLVAPVLEDGFIREKNDTRPAGKDRPAIKEAVTNLQSSFKNIRNTETETESESASMRTIELQSVIEQSCNFYLQHDRFPASYEELQPIPLLKAGILTYAGDDGSIKGQAHRLDIDTNTEVGVARFRFRCPNTAGIWGWRKADSALALPACLIERLTTGKGKLRAPTLREETKPSADRYAVLDFIVEVEGQALPDWDNVERVLGVDWGVHTLFTATAVAVNSQSEQASRPFFLKTGAFDGRQARTRRQIDELKKKIARHKAQLNALSEPDSVANDTNPTSAAKRDWHVQKISQYERELKLCWGKYERRNREIAHLASNVLILLCQVSGASLLSMESLTTLKSVGRGNGVKGRWRNYRNNTTVRGEIWRLLRYKCHLVGLRFKTCSPRGTSHTCPRCGCAADTYRSPEEIGVSAAVNWGRWLHCKSCGFNGDRDYCASLNIARLGVAYITQYKTQRVKINKGARTVMRPYSNSNSISDKEIKPVSYTGAGPALRLPPAGLVPARHVRGKLCYFPGWIGSVYLQSSQPRAVFLQLSG